MLSERDQIFCEKCAAGLMAYEAYLEAGFKCTSNESAQAAASRKMKEPGIKEEIRKIRERLCDENCLTLQEKRLRLAEIARGKALFSGEGFLFEVPPSHSERMKAIDLDNKMTGDYAPEKRDVSVQGIFFEDLFEDGQGGHTISEGSELLEGKTEGPALEAGASILD
ncbi:terminase small subunit [Akkermansia sp.]|uniref:terminase small subunit n=1 Tax=Akkermansia sp. TaxID=1872421 RepID=UPI003AB5029B